MNMVIVGDFVITIGLELVVFLVILVELNILQISSFSVDPCSLGCEKYMFANFHKHELLFVDELGNFNEGDFGQLSNKLWLAFIVGQLDLFVNE